MPVQLDSQINRHKYIGANPKGWPPQQPIDLLLAEITDQGSVDYLRDALYVAS